MCRIAICKATRDGLLTGAIIFLTGWLCLRTLSHAANRMAENMVKERLLETVVRAGERLENSQEGNLERSALQATIGISQLDAVAIVSQNGEKLVKIQNWQGKKASPKSPSAMEDPEGWGTGNSDPIQKEMRAELFKTSGPQVRKKENGGIVAGTQLKLKPKGERPADLQILEIEVNPGFLEAKIIPIKEATTQGDFWIWVLASTSAAGIGILRFREAKSHTREIEHTRLREKMAEEQRFLHVVAEKTVNGVTICNNERRIIWANNGFTKMTGYSEEEALGKTPGSLVQGKDTDPATIKEIRGALKKNEPFHGEIKNYKKTGEPYWIKLDIQPLEGPNGEQRGFLGMQTDITAQKERARLETHYREKAEEENKAKSRFVATMSHEIRTPLNGLLGYCHLLEATIKSPEQKEYLENIAYCGDTLLLVVDEILDFSKIEAGKMKANPQPTNLQEICVGAIASHRAGAEKKGLEIKEELKLDYGWAMAKGKMLAQVLGNLLSNAIKFTENGSITLKASQTQETTTFIVADTGRGIPEGSEETIFKAFFQLEENNKKPTGGTGLGLAICRGLAKEMGGSLRAERKEVGTTFILEVPTSPCEATKEVQQEKTTGARRILVVEDNRINSLMMVRILKNMGHTAEVAEDGVVAVSMGQNNEYNLIFMDVQMPRMNGILATQELRKAGCNSPIFGLTADAQKETMETCLAAGMTGYLTKPISISEIRNAISQNT